MTNQNNVIENLIKEINLRHGQIVAMKGSDYVKYTDRLKELENFVKFCDDKDSKEYNEAQIEIGYILERLPKKYRI